MPDCKIHEENLDEPVVLLPLGGSNVEILEFLEFLQVADQLDQGQKRNVDSDLSLDEEVHWKN